MNLEALRLRAIEISKEVGAKLGGERALRAVSPIVVPLALAPWLVRQVPKMLESPLFRDAAQCQYSGWCIRHGVKLYQDVGAPDGPLIHFLHAFLQIFVGVSDRGFRRADLVVQVLGSGAMGAALAPRFASTDVAKVLQRVAWACLGVSLWLPWYLYQGWPQTVQRDTYYALFGYLGVIFLYVSAEYASREARAMAFIGGALCTLMLFTRHSGIIATGAGALAVMLANNPEEELLVERRRAALYGGLTAFVAALVAVGIFGSIGGMGFWYFRFPFTFHRFLAKQNAFLLLTENYAAAGLIAVVALVAVFGGIATRILPRRAAGLGLAPFFFLIAACIVGKGWPNHVQQTTAAAVPLSLVLLSRLFGYRAERLNWSPVQSAAAMLGLVIVGYRAMSHLQEGSYFNMKMPQGIDGDIVEAKNVAAYLKTHTEPNDTVFFYGHESHVLLAAERKTAIPYYVNMIFDIDVLYRVWPAAPGEGPTPAEREKMVKLQADIAADACKRLADNPPAAAVFDEGSLGTFGLHGGVKEVGELCPALPKMLEDGYALSPNHFSSYNIYLRKDRNL